MFWWIHGSCVPSLKASSLGTSLSWIAGLRSRSARLLQFLVARFARSSKLEILTAWAHSPARVHLRVGLSVEARATEAQRPKRRLVPRA